MEERHSAKVLDAKKGEKEVEARPVLSILAWNQTQSHMIHDSREQTMLP